MKTGPMAVAKLHTLFMPTKSGESSQMVTVSCNQRQCLSNTMAAGGMGQGTTMAAGGGPGDQHGDNAGSE